MFRKLLAVGALGALVFAMPLGAQANHCAQKSLVLFSYAGIEDPNGQYRSAAAVNGNAIVCLFAPDDEVADTRLIAPAAGRVSVRYNAPVSGNPATLTVTLNGLGLSNLEVTLNRVVNATLGTSTYDSAFIKIDPTLSGSIDMSLPLPGGAATAVNCFHTIGAECADMPSGL